MMLSLEMLEYLTVSNKDVMRGTASYYLSIKYTSAFICYEYISR